MKHIELVLPENDLTGCVFCSVANWDGKVLKFARDKICNHYNRPDLRYAGVYMLIDEMRARVYIGETGNFHTRLVRHMNEDSWNVCIVITKKENALNKAHAQYLKQYLCRSVRESSRYELPNRRITTVSNLSENDTVIMNDFAKEVIDIIEILGYEILMYNARK